MHPGLRNLGLPSILLLQTQGFSPGPLTVKQVLSPPQPRSYVCLDTLRAFALCICLTNILRGTYFSHKVTKFFCGPNFVLRAYYISSLYNMLLRSGLWNGIQTPLQDLTLPAPILCM